MFGIHDSALNEVFCENLNSLFNKCVGLILKFLVDFIQERKNPYSTAIKSKENVLDLDKCIGLIDGTKIQISRPSGPTSRPRGVYSGQRRIHCLYY